MVERTVERLEFVLVCHAVPISLLLQAKRKLSHALLREVLEILSTAGLLSERSYLASRLKLQLTLHDVLATSVRLVANIDRLLPTALRLSIQTRYEKAADQ